MRRTVNVQMDPRDATWTVTLGTSITPLSRHATADAAERDACRYAEVALRDAEVVVHDAYRRVRPGTRGVVLRT